jgi:hypothetical protein
MVTAQSNGLGAEWLQDFDLSIEETDPDLSQHQRGKVDPKLNGEGSVTS